MSISKNTLHKGDDNNYNNKNKPDIAIKSNQDNMHTDRCGNTCRCNGYARGSGK